MSTSSSISPTPTMTMVETSELFVGDLSFFCSENDLHQLFASRGRVISIRIRRSEKSGDSLMHGFVKMSDANDARSCAASFDGLLFMGRYLRVQLCSTSGFQPNPLPKFGFPIHVSFISFQTIDKVVTEETFRSLFTMHGKVVDAIICRHKIQLHPLKQCGYGFVYMATQESANAAVHFLGQFDFDGIRFDSMYSTTKRDRQIVGHLTPYNHLPQVWPANNFQNFPPPYLVGQNVLPPPPPLYPTQPGMAWVNINSYSPFPSNGILNRGPMFTNELRYPRVPGYF